MNLAPRAATLRMRRMLRVALSNYVTNGLSVALGLLLISGLVHWWLGPVAGSAAAVGVIVASPPDQPWPRRGKLRQMLPAPLLGLPLFFAVQMLHSSPLKLGLLLIPATFIAFSLMAWGKRGIPIAVAVMLAMIFSMATPTPIDMQEIIERSGHFAMGAGLYVIYATLANQALNARFRTLAMADLLLTVATLMRTEARQFVPIDPMRDRREPPESQLGQVLVAQAALADQLQSTRDLVLESPRTPRRQLLAGMLVAVLEIRDHLVASELDLEALRADPLHARALDAMRDVFEELAQQAEILADSLLLMRRPGPMADRRPRLADISRIEPPSDRPEADYNKGLDASLRVDPVTAASLAMLVRAMANRLGNLNDEMLRLNDLARGELKPDLAAIRANWQLFVSPTAWSLRPFLALWHWDAPPLRHAIRATLAIAAGYAIAVALPWGSHDYWILLTIVVVLRGSLAQTLERRNSRVAGTLLGCVLAVGLLASHPPALFLLLGMAITQGIAHGFAARRYLITAVAATVLGLVQAHLLNTGSGPTFALFERIADTLIGAGLAWVFSYVLPSWEITQMGALVQRTLLAQARHATLALGLGQLRAIDSNPEMEWRLARREAFDSLSALVQATQRSLAEPRAVRPPISELERLQAHSYQFLAQLSAIKGMLVLRRDRLDPADVEVALSDAAARIDAALSQADAATGSGAFERHQANEASGRANEAGSDPTGGGLPVIEILAAGSGAAQGSTAAEHGTAPDHGTAYEHAIVQEYDAAQDRDSDGGRPIAPPNVVAATKAVVELGLPPLPDPFDRDISPWLLRRLAMACDLAVKLGEDGVDVRRAITAGRIEAAAMASVGTFARQPPKP